MNRAFGDTSFLFATLFDFDDHYPAATRLMAEISDWQLYTSTEVIGELLARATRWGPEARRAAVVWALGLLTGTSDIVCLHPTIEQVLTATNLYARRLDQRYSLVDCLSMTMMDENGIATVLTFDRDFHGERRFTVLPAPL